MSPARTALRSRNSRIPAPETKKLGDATMYYLADAAIGQDVQIAPNLVVSPKLVIKSLSLTHSERLLKATPLAMGSVRCNEPADAGLCRH